MATISWRSTPTSTVRLGCIGTRATAFHFDQLTQPTQQGACDLQGIDILGTSDIVAKARYPFQSVLNAGVDSKETVHKEVVNGYNKALYFEPKKGSFGHRVTAWATDINGQRLRHKEVVCFWTNDGKLDKVDGRGWYAPSGELCVRMKYAGNGGYLYLGVYDKPDASIAQVDLVGADPGAKVIATFKREKIKRMIVVGGKTDTGGATPPDGGKPTGSQTGPGTTAPTAAALKAAGIPQTQTRALRTAKAKFKKVRAHGKLKRGIVFAKFVSPTKRVKAKV